MHFTKDQVSSLSVFYRWHGQDQRPEPACLHGLEANVMIIRSARELREMRGTGSEWTR